MKDRGSRDSSRSVSKCEMVASINSSQNGGLASKLPHRGFSSRMGLKKVASHVRQQCTNSEYTTCLDPPKCIVNCLGVVQLGGLVPGLSLVGPAKVKACKCNKPRLGLYK